MKVTMMREFINNDIYFMETASDKVVINDNYQGVMILDGTLGVVENLHVFDDMVIDVSFVKGEELVLYCYENRCFVHLNVATCDQTVISMDDDLFDMSFLSLYEWTDDVLYLLAENGAVLVGVNMNTAKASRIRNFSGNTRLQTLRSDWRKLSNHIVQKVYPDRWIAAVESENSVIIINYRDDSESDLNIEFSPFHDIEITKAFVALIGEYEVSVCHEVKQMGRFLPPEGCVFLRGKFLVVDGIEYLFMLSSSISDSSLCRLEGYSLTDDL